ncbi:hypothetical protein [Variovorax gossypii]
MAETKKTASRLTRSETVTVRLDPQLRYLAELAARKQRRSLSSYIEWAVEISLKDVRLHEGTGYNGDESITVAEEAAKLWDVDESERFIKLAISYPALLTQEEQERWKLLNDSLLLAPARRRDMSGNVLWNNSVLEDKVFPVVRKEWPRLIEVHGAGTELRAKWTSEMRAAVQDGFMYPGYKPDQPLAKANFSDMDDDVPF